jgi:hypothetical protein
MSEYYDFECDERLFPDDELKAVKPEENYFEGLDLGFNFNFLENKENVPEGDTNFMENPGGSQTFFVNNLKNSENENSSHSFFNLKFSPSPMREGKKMQILNKLKSNFSNPESEIFTKSFLKMLNEKQSSNKSQDGTSSETLVINQNINNNYFINAPLIDDHRNQESQYNNIYKIKKMLADKQIRNILQVVRKVSDNESCDSNKTNKKIPIFKTVKIPKKASFNIDTFSLDSEKSSRKISESTPGSTKKELKKTIKLIRNRLSAQKSRLKKKFYIQKIEKELAATKESLNYYKTLSEFPSAKNGLDSKMLEVFYIFNLVTNERGRNFLLFA